MITSSCCSSPLVGCLAVSQLDLGGLVKHVLEGVRDVGTSNTSCCLRRAVSRFDRCVNILSVGLQGSSASGLPALGQLVRPRREVPSLDRGFEVTSAMPFLKPDVQVCGYSELSGMQYLSISRVLPRRVTIVNL